MSAADTYECTAKGEALSRGALLESEGDISDALRRVALTLAWLTSPSQPMREAAKRKVRDWVKLAGVSHAKRDGLY